MGIPGAGLILAAAPSAALAAVDPADLERACGTEPNLPCREVFEATSNETLADIAQWGVGVPLRILLIVVGALILTRLARRAVEGTLRRLADDGIQQRLRYASEMAPGIGFDADRVSARSGQRIEALVSVSRSVTGLLIGSIAALLTLDQVGISLAPLLAGAGVLGLAIGFGAQSLVKDFFSGLFILIEDQFAVGDIVDLGENSGVAIGVVEVVNLRTTRLRAIDGTVWHVPNGEIRRVGNMSQHWSRSLLDIEVSYETDIEKAKEVIKRIADQAWADDDDIVDEPEVWGVEELGASGVVIRLVIKTKPSEQWQVSRQMRQQIKEAFEKEGIEIPFPTQTLRIQGQDDPAV